MALITRDDRVEQQFVDPHFLIRVSYIEREGLENIYSIQKESLSFVVL